MREDALLTGPLEPTNEWYAIAKIAGIKMCQAYRRQYGFDAISLMPTNLYGPGDNFDLQNSHVLPALIRRFHEAKQRGDAGGRRSGAPARRAGSSCTSTTSRTRCRASHAALLRRRARQRRLRRGRHHRANWPRSSRRSVGFGGRIAFDATKPDGTPRKLLDSGKIRGLGWQPSIGLERGIAETCAWFRANATLFRG